MIPDRAPILESLQRFEREENVTVLSAREMGSRSQGLENENSDYDCMFAFIQDGVDYMGRDRRDMIKDSLEEPEVEFFGWNIDKLFGSDSGLSNSNPTATEFIMSDVNHYEPASLNDTWNGLREHVRAEFNPIAIYMHQKSMVKANYEKYITTGKSVSVKRNLNVFRSMMRARYVREMRNIPPSNFHRMMKDMYHMDMISGDEYNDGMGLADEKVNGDKYERIGNYVGEYVEPFLENGVDTDSLNEGHPDWKPFREALETFNDYRQSE